MKYADDQIPQDQREIFDKARAFVKQLCQTAAYRDLRQAEKRLMENPDSAYLFSRHAMARTELQIAIQSDTVDSEQLRFLLDQCETTLEPFAAQKDIAELIQKRAALSELVDRVTDFIRSMTLGELPNEEAQGFHWIDDSASLHCDGCCETCSGDDCMGNGHTVTH